MLITFFVPRKLWSGGGFKVHLRKNVPDLLFIYYYLYLDWTRIRPSWYVFSVLTSLITSSRTLLSAADCFSLQVGHSKTVILISLFSWILNVSWALCDYTDLEMELIMIFVHKFIQHIIRLVSSSTNGPQGWRSGLGVPPPPASGRLGVRIPAAKALSRKKGSDTAPLLNAQQ